MGFLTYAKFSSPPIEEGVSQVDDGGKLFDRGGIQAGDFVGFLNPSRLDACRIYEGVRMRVVRILAGSLSFCQLPDGSEQSFGLNTLELAT